MSRHTKVLSRSFAGGEMSPEMFSRGDDVMFQAGAETLLNCIPRPTGAVARRPGTRLIGETRDPDKIAHLLSFVFSPTQSTVIEGSRATIGGLEGGYFRFHTNGGTLLYPQPKRFKPSVSTDGAALTFIPCRTVSCASGSPMVVTLAGHGLVHGDQVKFVGADRTVPDEGASNPTRPLPDTFYYVRGVTTNTFVLSTDTTSGSRVTVTDHTGYYPVVFNWDKWVEKTAALQTISVPEHRLQNKDPVVITMWPGADNPQVTFSFGTHFDVTQVSGGPPDGLARTSECAQQVMFVASDFGGTLPSNLEEGRLYWVVSFDTPGLPYGWRISETFDGPPISLGSGESGTIRMCAMPELYGGSLGAKGEFSALRRYYAIVSANEPNTLKLEASIGDGQVVDGGLSFSPSNQGCGPFKIHQAHEIGDIVSYADASGGIRCFYAQKNWWDPQFASDQGLMTAETHSASGSRLPGSGQRTVATQGAYWRELSGRSTGGLCPVTANEFAAVLIDLTLSAIGGDHGYGTGTAVVFVDGRAPAGITAGTVYYAVDVGSGAFKVSDTYLHALAGTDIIEAPTGASLRWGALQVEAFVSFVASTHKVRWPEHGLSVGDTVVFSKSDFSALTDQALAAGGNLARDTAYYVRETETNFFRISETAAGPLIEFTGSDGDRHAAVGASIYEVPHSYSEEELPRISTTQSGDVMTMASRDTPVTELRRVSSTKWKIAEANLTSGVDAPKALVQSALIAGEGVKLVSSAEDTTNVKWYFNVGADSRSRHGFEEGNPVYVDGMTSVGVADGYYICDFPTAVSPDYYRIYLKSVESGATVIAVANSGLNGRIRYGTQGEDRDQTYVVTAIDDNNEESVASVPLTFSNNLYVSGAYNTLGWAAAAGAVRYRVYKEISGLYGMIGETDTLLLKDDNIGPDLSVSPPISDLSLRKQARVTFNATADTVLWSGHEFDAKTPVVFATSDRLPGPEEGKAYYVINPGPSGFQITADPDSDTVVSITGTDTGFHTAVGGDFPSTATYFEGRRVFGGSRSHPQDIWMTASGTEGDLTYSIPTVDSDRVYFRIAAREIASIRHLIPLTQLVMLSDSTEFRLTPLNDDVVTPSSISVRPQSFVGAGYPQPSLVNNTVVFAAARGGHMRELGYSRDVLGYLTGDLSIRAAHLFDGFTIDDQAYAKAPIPVVWCVSSTGKLLGLTYIPEENVGAWHQHTTPASGLFESVTVVPEGDEDAVYVVVQRTIGGTAKRYVERFANEFRGDTADLEDAFFVDCGLTYDGTATTSITGLDHLDDETVSYLADGLVGTGTVTSGALTLATAASKVHVGLGFTTTIKTLPLSMMKVDAFGTGRQKNVNQVWVRIFQSGAFEAGPTESRLRPSRSPAAGLLADGLVQVTLPASWDDDGQIFVQQSTPLPLTVSGLTIEVASGG